MVINTNDEKLIAEFEGKKQQLINEKLDNLEYGSSDVALVRVTDHLPNNGMIYSLSNVPFLTRINDLSSRVAFDILREKEQQKSGKTYLGDEKENYLLKISKEYSPLSTQYRSTVHFTLNGIVSNHQYGTFDSPFVIVEPFSHHENDSNILSVRGDDTYFKDYISLSSDSVVLLPLEYKYKVNSVNMNAIFYNGDRDKALDMYLVSIGIVPETIKDSYVEESKTSPLLNRFIESKGYSRERHCYHPVYRIDDERSMDLWKYYDDKFYTYLFKRIYPEGTHLAELDILKNKFNMNFFDERPFRVLKDIVSVIGLAGYKKIVDGYNNELLSKVSIGEYPTNNEILGISPTYIGTKKNKK